MKQAAQEAAARERRGKGLHGSSYLYRETGYTFPWLREGRASAAVLCMWQCQVQLGVQERIGRVS